MSEPTWRRALITGASSGIGEAMARRLAAEGTALVLVARNVAALESLASEFRSRVEVEVLPADLSDASQVAAVAERIGADTDPVDLVVNNAGFGYHHQVADAELGRELGMVAVNVEAVVHLTHAASQVLRRRGRGGIVNLSSVAGTAASPGLATYAASKSFVTSYTQAVHEELKPHGVSVTAVCPGFTRTDFQRRADYDPTSLPDFVWQSADTVARAALDGARRNAATVVPGWHNKMAVTVVKLTPTALVRRIGKLLVR